MDDDQLLPEPAIEIDITRQTAGKLFDRFYDAAFMAQLAPVINLAVSAHDGKNGLDNKPLVLHCADVTTSIESPTMEQVHLGLLHDATSPIYSNFSQDIFTSKAKEAGVSERVIGAAICFAQPEEGQGWAYDDWISYLMRDDLTRIVKIADLKAMIEHFPPQSQNQLDTWQHTLQRLTENAPEAPDVTERINAAMRVHPLPQLESTHTVSLSAESTDTSATANTTTDEGGMSGTTIIPH